MFLEINLLFWLVALCFQSIHPNIFYLFIPNLAKKKPLKSIVSDAR